MIKFFIRLCFGKAIRKRNAARKHNAGVLQELLDKEHRVANIVNYKFNSHYTTKKALEMARIANVSNYNSNKALINADFWNED